MVISDNAMPAERLEKIILLIFTENCPGIFTEI